MEAKFKCLTGEKGAGNSYFKMLGKRLVPLDLFTCTQDLAIFNNDLIVFSKTI